MLPFELTKDTPYLALSDELWSVFYEYFNRNWSCYKGFLLYWRENTQLKDSGNIIAKRKILEDILCICFNTVRCRYYEVYFIKKNIHKEHPITRPLGRGKGCILWTQHLIGILPVIIYAVFYDIGPR